jgi:gliding motility-associated-like protein
MIFKITIYLNLLFCNFQLLGQLNFVTNGSFEDIDSCYGGTSSIGFDVFEWSGCDGWTNPIKSSSDLWCENPIAGPFTPPEIIPLGCFQNPRSGQNMTGILISDVVGYENYKEYVQNELITPLNIGKTYKLTFFVNRSNKDDFTCHISNIGALFTENKIVSSTALWLDSLGYSAKNNASNFLSDTSDWVEVKLLYTAKGNEKFVTIGSFNSTYQNDIDFSNQCDTSGFGFTGGYFFIDDVSLIEIPFIAEFSNVFTPNNDGVNDSWTPKIISGGDWKIDILNRWGILVTTLSQNNPKWAEPSESDGVYFYRFYSKDLPNESRSGFIHLIH